MPEDVGFYSDRIRDILQVPSTNSIRECVKNYMNLGKAGEVNEDCPK